MYELLHNYLLKMFYTFFSYHAFYNLMSDQVPDLKSKCLLSNDIYDYWWVAQGKVTVESIDDKEDMMYAHQAYEILGFSEEDVTRSHEFQKY